MNRDERALLASISRPSQDIMHEALETIDYRYSPTGDAINDPQSELYFPYHNGLHTRNVCKDIRLLRDVVGLTEFEYETASLAGVAHDIDHPIDAVPGKSEESSAEWLASIMSRQFARFSGIQINNARLGIIGTTVRHDEYGNLIQKAFEQPYPSKRSQTIAFVVAAADLGRVYRPDGPLLSHRLFQERQTGASGKIPSIENLVKHQKQQLVMLGGNISYGDRDIEKALKTHYKEVMDYNQLLLQDLEKGNVTTWEEVIKKDTAFQESCI